MTTIIQIDDQDFLAVAAGENAYVYKWQDYGTTNVADGTVSKGIGFEIFQVMIAYVLPAAAV
jgi:hypothetical protein